MTKVRMQKGMVALILLCMLLTMLPVNVFAETADKAGLDATISEAQALCAEDYTPESWSGVDAALTAALKVQADEEAVQEDVDSAATAIADALQGLVLADQAVVEPEDPAAVEPESLAAALAFAGQTALDEAIAAAAEKVETDYTATSWAALTAALAMPQDSDEEVTAKTEAINAAIAALVYSPAGIVKNAIAALDVQSIDDRESVVLARRLFEKLETRTTNDKPLVENAAAGSNLETLEVAEANILNLWINDLYTGDPEAPVDHARSLGLWVLDEAYDGMSEAHQELVTDYDKLEAMDEYSAEVLAPAFKEDYNAAKVVQAKIAAMDPFVGSEVKAVRAAYDGLTDSQKAIVTNYEVLKKAEGTNDVVPSNIKFAGTRSTSYGTNLSLANWQLIDDTLQGYFPNTQSTYVWITGMLDPSSGTAGSCRIDIDFDKIDEADGNPDGKYKGKTEAEWKNENITFKPSGALKQKDYLDYFDKHDIYVYLQVESAFADMKTLMDIYYDVFNVADHKCVKGFAIDVEWYWGISEDSGIPVTDERAREWNEYLYETWGPGMQLFLKHYAATWLPTTYRGGNGSGEKLVFCDDSQSFGSFDGEMGGVYDENDAYDGATMGFGREFKLFADYYPDNDVIYQIGYQPDREWYYAFDDPIIKSFGIKMGEVTNPNQNVGIAWVNFSLKDPLTFPSLMNPTEAASAVNGLLNYLISTKNPTNNLVGRRFDGNRSVDNDGGGATLSDAIYIKRMRDLVNALTDEQRAMLTPARVTRLEELEPKAVDIRIGYLPDVDHLGMKDYNTVKEIYDTYGALSPTQKGLVSKAQQLTQSMELLNTLKDTKFTLTIAAGKGGSIRTGANGEYAYGDTLDIKAVPNARYVFSGWTTNGGGIFADEGSATTKFTMSAANTVITANFTYVGGSGGGGSGNVITPAPEPDVTKDGDTTTISAALKATADPAKATATAKMDGSEFKALVEKAKEAEASGQKAVVEIKVEAAAGTKAVEVEIPRDAFNAMADASKAELKVDTGIGTVTFDAKGVESISGAADAGDISISVARVDASTLTPEIRETVGDRPVYDFSVRAGNTVISDFGGGQASISIPYTPKPGENEEAIVVYYIDNTGKLNTVRGRYDPATGTVNFSAPHFSRYAIGYNKVSFSDVAANAPYSKAVGFMAARGIVNGVGGDRFAPESNVTRADFLIMLMNSYGIELDTTVSGNFADAGNKYYTPYLATAKRLGIVTGVGENRYAPEAGISRQDMFVMLYRALNKLGELPTGKSGGSLASFNDTGDISSYASDAVKLFVETGIISGDEKALRPKTASTRAEVAQALYNLLSK